MKNSVLAVWTVAVACGLLSAVPSQSSEKPLPEAPVAETHFLKVGETYTFMFASGQRLDRAQVMEKLTREWVKVEGGLQSPKSTCWVNLKHVESVYLNQPRLESVGPPVPNGKE